MSEPVSARWRAAENSSHYALYYRDLRRKTIFRLLYTYLAPLLLALIYFIVQYRAILAEAERHHLQAIAENQANTLNLFLSERLVNLSNLIDDPAFRHAPTTAESLAECLASLKRDSETFVDLGYFGPIGVQTAYAGPFAWLEQRDYSSEPWYQRLKEGVQDFVITDVYLGFRQRPHFTIAVARTIDGHFVVLRASLDPERIYDYIRSLEGSSEVHTSVVNRDGYFQLVTPPTGKPLDISPFVPGAAPRLGTGKATFGPATLTCAYAWLPDVDWAVIVRTADRPARGFLSGPWRRIFGTSAVIIFLSLVVILNRARKIVEFQTESDSTRAQLEHAAKLASVGELAAGIAHEINNPLASISEEAGLLKDLLDPEYGESLKREEIVAYLDSIQESVYRCRDVTGKLLRFVRKTDMDLQSHDVHRLIDNVVDGLLAHEMTVSDIEIRRNYGTDIPPLTTDGHQLEQVLLNILNNAVDAMEGRPGRIAITTSRTNGEVRVALADTGKGMSTSELQQIFMPFYTTKEVGKGTGLGLSVSYGIVKHLGGRIEVESKLGEGSTFAIMLPVR